MRLAALFGALAFGALALTYLLERDRLLAAPFEASANPLAAKPSHFGAKAKSVIFLFMEGGPSHMDTLNTCPHNGLLRPAVKPRMIVEANRRPFLLFWRPSCLIRPVVGPPWWLR